ncbi:response regulator [Roseospira visakhapatnamensis]|uniref:CheY-like chemotaxis protein n=1 Tax=Roseospira visakhapatnamensis TaxID=390880 RepID=A0A7W6RG19_9PROT|nr:response regulator [Roseospira visakhapatnamensis]MBB4267331.1 CheY-like chemotaxis protein [Roseospira visakhapatnamensis]
MSVSKEDGLSRVLLVEDDRDVRAIAELALVDLGGFEVLTCATGAEALRKVDGFQPDILLLDLALPDMDGLDLAEALVQPDALQVVSPPPVVFLTARPERAEQAAETQPGIIGVLAKPFDPMTLAGALQSLWLTWKRDQGRRSRG